MNTKIFIIAVLLLASFVGVMGQQNVQRVALQSILLTEQKLTKIETQEITIPAAGKGVRHWHPCPVIGYIKSGTVLFQVEGEAAQLLEQGAVFYEPKGVPILHFDNASTTVPLTFIAYYLLEGEEELIKIWDTDLRLVKSACIEEQTASDLYVNGCVTIKNLLTEDVDCHLSEVTFYPEARTHWHSHPNTQILIGKSGRGYVQKQQGEILPLLPGDVVVIPANQIHWHGAGPQQTFIHTAIQIKNDTAWVSRPLSEQEYRAVYNF